MPWSARAPPPGRALQWARGQEERQGPCGARRPHVLDHPHRAVWVLVATLVVVAGARLAIPGRPWFASRYRGADAAVLLAVAGAIAYLSSYTSTMAVH